MNQKQKHIISIILTACAFLLSACQEELELRENGEIYFSTSICDSSDPATRSMDLAQLDTTTLLQDGDEPVFLHTNLQSSIVTEETRALADSTLTRGAPITSMYDKFSVSAYSFARTWSGSGAPNFINDVPATRTGSNYILSPTYDWPGAEYQLRFYSYAPMMENSPYRFSHDSQTSSPIINVTIPDDIARQKDLVTAKTSDINGNSNIIVPLTFKHALTAVRFVCDNDMGIRKVNSISLKNIYSEGTYNMEYSVWSAMKTIKSFSITDPHGGAVGDLSNLEETFMMIPQRLPQNAAVEIKYTDNNGQLKTLTGKIGSSEWPMGWTVTYHISRKDENWEYVLDATDPIEFTYEGGTSSCGIKSYRKNIQNPSQIEAMPWQIVGYSQNEGASWSTDIPEWLTITGTSGPGNNNGTATDYPVKASKQKGIVSDSDLHAAILRGREARGTESMPWNLSNKTGAASIENTANCYIVEASGCYSFPLVYGNAIKNGGDNKESYNYSGKVPTDKLDNGDLRSDHILNTLINHEGTEITSPFIIDNITLQEDDFTAELIWQDAMDLVTGIKWNPGEHGGTISFKVDKETIRQGNAVIAIKNAAGQVMWSWHIWVTDNDFYDTDIILNHYGVSYQLARYHLGWCDISSTFYKQRESLVKLTNGKKTKVISVRQLPHEVDEMGNHPFFMWGRKDPFIPVAAAKVIKNSKTWYDKNGQAKDDVPAAVNVTGKKKTCLKNYILYPEQMHAREIIGHDGLGDDWYFNLWNSGNALSDPNDLPTIKTIYDPCPTGFVVPPGNTFTGFTTTGKSINPQNGGCNGEYYPDKYGFYFYTSKEKNKGVYFSISGYRQYQGAASVIGSEGFAWTSTPHYKPIYGDDNVTIIGWEFGYGKSLSYKWEWMNPIQEMNRGFALGIRPVKEN